MKQMTPVGRTVAVIGGCVMILACVLYVLSNGLPLWHRGVISNEPVGIIETVGTRDLNGSYRAAGLWLECNWNTNNSSCTRLPLTCSGDSSSLCLKRIFARVFLTAACFVSLLSALCLFISIVIKSKLHRILTIIAKILPLISLIFGFTGVALGIAYVAGDLMDTIREAAILGITAVCTNIIGVLLALAMR
ncbi:unnamed protein product [Adineta ricciae]|uniref:Uncharacterized protein n=1 Tax=Adineta ricciae TaxID=249248 RepID=A0A816D7J7_ADIRI|nr:unnamed protein product [Adineta ricciae]